ncbi:NmrA family transcriptional regulator [Devosia insulae DS-56]|uniref:NmrA family transcriptional regulator n=1 Tax=Devosia insulae DS-56 TaxID=1116389 RepID=A0A1E5XHM2_9HYPH|nr:NAD(P)H-binding protein [Devosia insulae]OEO28098.1 NmrA family transcriptional regulator [Devosia insulae DS-56]
MHNRPKRVVVIGGTGLIGTRLAARLQLDGHDVIATSPASGVNTVSGDGLWEVLEDAEVVIDVANAPSFEAEVALAFFSTAGRNLIAAGRSQRIAHHVALSVVGADRLVESGYFRAKLEQESIVRASDVPYTILRATQFMEFMPRLATSGGDSRLVRVALALTQPIAADDVAVALATIAAGEPVNDIVEVAGPEAYRLSDVVGRVLANASDDRLVIADSNARYLGARLGERTLIPGPAPLTGSTLFDAWLSRTRAQATSNVGELRS